MKGPRLTAEQKATILGETHSRPSDLFGPRKLMTCHVQVPTEAELEELREKWKASRDARDLIAYSDAVGAWSARLHKEFVRLSGAWREQFEKEASGPAFAGKLRRGERVVSGEERRMA